MEAGETVSEDTDALTEAREVLYWKLQDARSHMQAVREAAEAFAVYDELVRENATKEAAAVVEALRTTVRLQEETLALLRKHGIQFTDIGADPRNWQHVAFAIYTNMCEAASEARAIIEEVEASGRATATAQENAGAD